MFAPAAPDIKKKLKTNHDLVWRDPPGFPHHCQRFGGGSPGAMVSPDLGEPSPAPVLRDHKIEIHKINDHNDKSFEGFVKV